MGLLEEASFYIQTNLGGQYLFVLLNNVDPVLKFHLMPQILFHVLLKQTNTPVCNKMKSFKKKQRKKHFKNGA